MALVVDSFTEAADANLDTHTPDTGTTWVEVALVGTTEIKIFAATDNIGGAGNVAANGQYLKSQPAPTAKDVDVQITCTTIDGGSTNARKFRLHARASGTSDYYAVRFSPPGAAVNDVELVKVVGGVLTSLGSVDTGITNGDVFVLKIRDAAKEVLKNGVSILSSADNAITTAGDCGVSMGQVSAADTGNIAGVWRWDDYSVTEVTSGTTYNQSAGGTLTTAGAGLKQTQTAKAGTLGSAAALARQTARSLAGTLDSAGALTSIKTALISITATLSSSGALAKQTAHGLAGALTSAATLARQTAHSLAGSLSTAGALAATKTALLSIGATLTTGGALAKQAGKSLTGSLTSAGSVGRAIAKGISGVLAFVGDLVSFGGQQTVDLPYAGDLTIYDSATGAGAIGSGAVQPSPTAASATGSASGATILPSEGTYG